jgi:hypothetical protein
MTDRVRLYDIIIGIERREPTVGQLLRVIKNRNVDNRPDIEECRNDQGIFFILKAYGDVLTERASDALLWASNSGRSHTAEQKISRNSTWLRFANEEDSALFKLFWL